MEFSSKEPNLSKMLIRCGVSCLTKLGPSRKVCPPLHELRCTYKTQCAASNSSSSLSQVPKRVPSTRSGLQLSDSLKRLFKLHLMAQVKNFPTHFDPKTFKRCQAAV